MGRKLALAAAGAVLVTAALALRMSNVGPTMARDSVRASLEPARTGQPRGAWSAPQQARAAAGDALLEQQLRRRLQRSSLRGARPDGALAVDRSGRLVPDLPMLRRFDWYLSLAGEFDTDEIRTLVFAATRDEHGDEIASEFLAWFDRYLGLREALAATALSTDPSVRIAQLRDLQRTWFGAHAEALFGAELAELEYAIARREILADPTLTSEQREIELALAGELRPAAAREAEREASAALLLAEQARQFAELALDPAQRHAERAALWGEEAADRLEALDASEADWILRLGRYADASERLLRETTLPASERQRRLQALRERLFTPAERPRVEALEAIGRLRHAG